MKKVVVAVDSFKGCLTSREAEWAVKEGILSVFPACEVLLFPISDGGEGFLEGIASVVDGEFISLSAHDPLMETKQTRYFLSTGRKTAFIEMAAISGLVLVSPPKRNPLLTTTFGTGELIRDALDRGCRNFVIGIGGSATNDAGLGMLQALGYRFLDKNGNPVGTGGEKMADVISVDSSRIHPALKDSRFTIACDVRTSFCGPEGAAFTFAAQKGADQAMMEKLDTGMQSLVEVMERFSGKEIRLYPGSGAAGGMGGGFLAFLNAELKAGITFLLEVFDFEKKIAGADLIITGEGKIDKQTLMGKVPCGILEVAAKQHIPVIAIAGRIEDAEKVRQAGFKGIYSIVSESVSPEKAMNPEFAKQSIKKMISGICRL